MSNPADFSKNELERYSRQILLYGRAGQQRLKQARVVVIGAGGLGSTFLPVLAASGVGEIVIYDGDTVERSNLGRQLLYTERDLGQPKAIAAAERLATMNPHVQIQGLTRRFEKANAETLRGASLVFEGSDSLRTKFLLNDLCLSMGIPLVISALGNAQGHTMLIAGHESACYRCIFEEIDEKELPTCGGEGILSAFPALVAAQAAHVAVSRILDDKFTAGLWVFEKSHCRSVGIRKRKDCLHS
ncbi:MAG: HesA/MoeB/ThiF family protein [Spirochaetota bacterium]